MGRPNVTEELRELLSGYTHEDFEKRFQQKIHKKFSFDAPTIARGAGEYIEWMKTKVSPKIQYKRDSKKDKKENQRLFRKLSALVSIILTCRAAAEYDFRKKSTQKSKETKSRRPNKVKTERHEDIIKAYYQLLTTLDESLKCLGENSVNKPL